MIDFSAVDDEIAWIEDNCSADDEQSVHRLASLYTVREHLGRQPDEYTDDYSGSDFMEAASGVDLDGFMRVTDEHMEGLRIVFPKEYDSVMEKIRSLTSVVM